MMNTSVFFALTANGNSFAENAKLAGTVTLLGMVAIFSVLALLWGIIELLHLLLAHTGAKKKKPEESPAPAPAPAAAKPAPAKPVAKQPEAKTAAPAAPADDGALIAAITAAISAAMAEEGYTGGFRVVSFKRTPARRQGRF